MNTEITAMPVQRWRAKPDSQAESASVNTGWNLEKPGDGVGLPPPGRQEERDRASGAGGLEGSWVGRAQTARLGQSRGGP